MTEDMRIDVVSQELFEEVLRTVPIVPQQYEVDLLASGIILPSYSICGDYNEADYLVKCDINNIIPFSNLLLKYSKEEGLFVPKFGFFDSSLMRFDTKTSPQIKEESIEKLIEGRGRINLINVEGNEHNFGKFNNELLDCLLENGYQLSKGNLWLTTYHLSGYNQGDYADTTLLFNSRRLELRIGSEISDEDRKSVLEWYRDLFDKYITGQQKLNLASK